MIDIAKKEALCRWIREELSRGIVLADDLLNYLDATFGSQDLPSVLSDADAGEIDSLLELLFYPDTAIQLRFEAQWGNERLTDQDKDSVIGLLCAAPPESVIAVPGSGAKLHIRVPDFASESFVQRLNIVWQPCAELSKVLNEYCTDEEGLRTRVRLRNARLAWHQDHVALICRYITHVPSRSETFAPDLDFFISILSELEKGRDHYTFLAGKKFFYFKSLCSAEDYERKRLSSNMEIMMMAGNRSAHGSIDQWRQDMRRIDRICNALFGRTQFFQQPDSQCIGTQNGLNMQDVMRVLSSS